MTTIKFNSVRSIVLILLVVCSASRCLAQQPTPTTSHCIDETEYGRKPFPEIVARYPTRLLRAIALEGTGCVRELLVSGTSPKATDGTRDPLDLAIEADLKIAQLLIDHGADIELRDGRGMTPLIRAAFEGDDHIVRFLLANGANINAKAAWGSTALLWATMNGNLDVVKLLLLKGAEVDLASQYGRTPLMVARNDREIVELLLKAGAKIDAVDQNGMTAACLAVKDDRKDKLAALLKHDPHIADQCK